jgi:hypothetical protein
MNGDVRSRSCRIFRVCDLLRGEDSSSGQNLVRHRLDRASGTTEKITKHLRGHFEELLAALNCLQSKDKLLLTEIRKILDNSTNVPDSRPIVVFPAMEVRFQSGKRLSLKISATVCSEDSRSKLWVRLSESDLDTRKNNVLDWGDYTALTYNIADVVFKFYQNAVFHLLQLETDKPNTHFVMQKYKDVAMIAVTPTEELGFNGDLVRLDDGDVELHELVEKYNDFFSCYPFDQNFQEEGWVFIASGSEDLGVYKKLTYSFNPIRGNDFNRENVSTIFYYGVTASSVDAKARASRKSDNLLAPDITTSRIPLEAYAPRV